MPSGEKKPAAGSDATPARRPTPARNRRGSVPAVRVAFGGTSAKRPTTTQPAAAARRCQTGRRCDRPPTRPARRNCRRQAGSPAATPAGQESAHAEATRPRRPPDPPPTKPDAQEEKWRTSRLRKSKTKFARRSRREKANRLIDETFQRLSVKNARVQQRPRRRTKPTRRRTPALEAPEPLDLAGPGQCRRDDGERDRSGQCRRTCTPIRTWANRSPLLRSAVALRLSGQFPFRRSALRDRLFNPEITQDNEGDRYLSWKIQETPEGVPDFDEVRSDVVRAHEARSRPANWLSRRRNNWPKRPARPKNHSPRYLPAAKDSKW